MTSQHTTLVNWLDWGPEAFERAKRDNKPILLDISAAWCHWCHRLDEDTYSNPEVAVLINAQFIPVRVDTDRRPDINRRYNMGGWLTTAFLTPDGRVISGGTYIPPNNMKMILREVVEHWNRNKGLASTQVGEPVGELGEEREIKKGDLSSDIVTDLIGEIANNFDPIYGGFGSAPKFPQTGALELALARYHYTRNRELLGIVTTTLDSMAAGGIHDHEMGGFFRYSTSRDWSVPHYEKMSEDNARLLKLYLTAFQATGIQRYREVALDIIGYINSTLSDEAHGGFFGSQDADEEYYKLSKPERLRVKAPSVDRTLYTNWNAMMSSAYLLASFVLDLPDLSHVALRTLDRLLEVSYQRDGGMCHYYDGQPHLYGLLADQIQMASALIDAFEASGESKYLASAEDTVSVALRTLYDREVGGFYDATVNPDAPGFLKRPAKPLDENSAAVYTLLKLYHLTDKEEYRQRAGETLRAFADVYPPYGIMAAEYGLAVGFYLQEPSQFRIVGSLNDPRTRMLLAESWRLYDPMKVVQVLDPRTDFENISKLGYLISDTPTAYICIGQTCTAPIRDPTDIRAQVARLVEARPKR